MFIKTIIYLFLITTLSFAEKPVILDRDSWTFEDTNTTASGIPSNLKFLKYYDVIPDEVSIEILNKRDLSSFAGKHVYVGYGVVDPHGNDCKIFTPENTGMENNVTICLPWWRIERDYQKSLMNIKDISDILCELPTPHPPIRYDICKEWANTGDLSTTGGKVTCTSYYNRLESADCWANPKQSKCLVDNCSIYTKNNCTYVGAVMGDAKNLPTAQYKGNNYLPTETKLNVVSYQYKCPAGTVTPYTQCKNKQSVLMFPYECAPDNPDTVEDDSVYVYCNEKKPQYDNSGNAIGFLGKCPDSKDIVCDVDSFSQTTRICQEPINTEINTTSFTSSVEEKTFKEFTVDVLSGEVDIYAEKPNCVRSNTVDAARDRIITAHIKGVGSLDDDIYVLRHRSDGSHLKVYCNMQHNENHGSRKSYNGSVLQCIDNNGNYSFNKNIEIDSSDIVTIQQNTENENSNGTPFAGGRTHYNSSKVEIDGITAAPETNTPAYPYYPSNGGYNMRIWENNTATLSIMFPYTGAYQIFFFNKTGDMVAKQDISMDDFDDMKNADYIQLKLARQMDDAPGFDRDNTATACIDDDWSEWGGGVYGGKASKTGTPCQIPNDSFVKSKAVYKVIVKDLLTGNITPIPLVYPLPYPNRVFVSKLKLYELRKYRCYDEFNEDVLP